MESLSAVAAISECFNATPLLHIHINLVRSRECITIRHLNLRERLAVHNGVFLDDIVLEEHKRGESVYLIRGKSSGSKERAFRKCSGSP